METLNLDDVRVHLVNLYCVECQMAFPDIETFECHHDDENYEGIENSMETDEENEGEEEEEEKQVQESSSESEVELKSLALRKRTCRSSRSTSRASTSNDSPKKRRGRPPRKKTRRDYSSNDENVAPAAKNRENSINNQKNESKVAAMPPPPAPPTTATPTISTNVVSTPGMLDIMSVNFFELQDYLHCCRCFECFYTLPDLLLHFRNCNVQKNSTFTQFKRGDQEPQTSSNTTLPAKSPPKPASASKAHVVQKTASGKVKNKLMVKAPEELPPPQLSPATTTTTAATTTTTENSNETTTTIVKVVEISEPPINSDLPCPSPTFLLDGPFYDNDDDNNDGPNSPLTTHDQQKDDEEASAIQTIVINVDSQPKPPEVAEEVEVDLDLDLEDDQSPDFDPLEEGEEEAEDSDCSSSYSPSKSKSRSKSSSKSDTVSNWRFGPRKRLPKFRPNAKGEYICPQCSKSYPKERYLKNHHIYVHGEKQFKCPHCKYRTTKLAVLRGHVRGHHPESTIVINRASATKTSEGKEGSDEKDSDSDEDGEGAGNNEDGDDQVIRVPLIQNEDGHFPCQLCPKVLPEKIKLWMHLRYIHGPKTCKCPHCPYTATKLPMVTAHMKRRHPNSTAVASNTDKMAINPDGRRRPPRIVFLDPSAVEANPTLVNIPNADTTTTTTTTTTPGENNNDDDDDDDNNASNENEEETLWNIEGKAHISLMGDDGVMLTYSLEPDNNGDYPCQACGKTYALPERLKSHYVLVHGEKVFKCPVKKCKYAATKLPLVRLHVTRRHPNFKEHISRHNTYSSLMDRIGTNPGTPNDGNPVKVEKDLDAFSDEENPAGEEQEKEAEEPKFKCNVCWKWFKKESYLKTHKLNSHGPKMYKCHKCLFATTKPATLANHLKTHSKRRKEGEEPILATNSHLCFICGANLVSAQGLVAHMKRHEGQFTCPRPGCDYRSGTLGVLNSHIKIVHEKVKTHLCPHCGRRFANTTILNRHLRCHTGERPFKCSECPSAFKDKGTLENHVYHYHRGVEERPYKCSHCDKRFVTNCDHKRHERIHSGIKPYECKFCKARFMDNKPLRFHVLRAHPNEDFDPKNPSSYQGAETDIGKRKPQKTMFLTD